jgi:hypothetical protein
LLRAFGPRKDGIFVITTQSPYGADEIFISSNGASYNENRFYSGVEFELTKYVKADIYYLLKNNRAAGGKWSRANALGTKLKIMF